MIFEYLMREDFTSSLKMAMDFIYHLGFEISSVVPYWFSDDTGQADIF